MLWILPSPHFGYVITQIDDHPWNTLITMKEILLLEPGSLHFHGPNADAHREYWRKLHPHLIEGEQKPVFQLDTTGVHPHKVESEPRRPFQPWKKV